MNSLTKALVCLFCSGSLFIIVANGVEDTHGVEAPRYTEEAYTLKDGTLCTIIRGGSHAGIVGVSCNYNQHRIGDN